MHVLQHKDRDRVFFIHEQRFAIGWGFTQLALGELDERL